MKYIGIKSINQALFFSCFAIFLISCSSSKSSVVRTTVPAPMSTPSDFSRPSRDGAPWWNIDISKIPDAVPSLHNGGYKNNVYTVMGKTYQPLQDFKRYRAIGEASWYGTKFHGQQTANGEAYDLFGMTAAHKTLPLPCYVKVTNLENNRSVIVRVNDRGPFYSDRIIDLSFAAAKKLGYADTGVAKVSVEGIDPAAYWGQKGQSAPYYSKNGSKVPLTKMPVVAQSSVGQRQNTNKPIQLPEPEAGASSVTESMYESYTPVAIQSNEATASSFTKKPQAAASGLYLQVGAFSNPRAAQMLQAKIQRLNQIAPSFISSVESNRQILHRVRIGPFPNESQAIELQESIRVANLGEPTLVQGH